MNKQFENMQKLAFGKILINESTKKMTKSAFTTQIKEMILNEMNEAKKDKADVAPQDPEAETPDVATAPEVSTEVPIEEPTSDDMTTDEEGKMDPLVKKAQDDFNKAYASAKALGDEKLTTQMGNTVMMLVRTHILGGKQAVAEGMEGINDEIYNDIDLAVSDEAYNRFIDAASAISNDLISKGFEAKDIYDYLNNITLNEA